MRSDDNLGIFLLYFFLTQVPAQPRLGQGELFRGALYGASSGSCVRLPYRPQIHAMGSCPYTFSVPLRLGRGMQMKLCVTAAGGSAGWRLLTGDTATGTGTGRDKGLHFGHPPPSLPRVAAYTKKAHLFYPILSWVVAIREQGKRFFFPFFFKFFSRISGQYVQSFQCWFRVGRWWAGSTPSCLCLKQQA